MKNTTKKIGFTLIAAATMLLASCGGGTETTDSKASKPATTSSSTPKSVAPDVELPKYKVTFKNADGTTLKEEEVELRKGITKPADPTAPAGKAFYGWKNVNNGGQIWDFEEEHELNQVMGEVTLEPVFVPASMAVQTFEAELCPEITEANGGTGMDGATYSGGAKGKQFIGRDYDGIYGATCVSSYKYYEVYASQADLDDEVIDGYAETYETIEAGKLTKEKNVEVNYGAYVHFNYNKGNLLSFKLNSDVAATGVSLFARFSAEYGKPLSTEEVEKAGYEDTIDAFSDDDFKISVNGVQQKYGDVAIHNIEGTSGAKFIYCQDYFIGNVDLQAGENTIELLVDNNKTLNGTIAASAPVVDSIKLYSSSTLTWPTAKYTNLVRE